jgi:glycosyltransferase involved in cell wall biosynthesis
MLGPEEDVLVEQLRAENPNWARRGVSSPPGHYWEMWREECALADRIIVNSAWSKSLMEKAGINSSKIEIIPLAYEIPTNAAVAGDRELQSRDSSASLRVLFLGQAIVRKGIQDLATAAHTLTDLSIQIDVVGPHGSLPEGLPSNLIFHGSVPRSEVAAWYDQAEVFLLPTHSDGFALTQLEAMAHGLPVIATPACGEVVIDGVNGWLVPPGDPDALADRMRWMLEHRDQHSAMSEAARKRAAEFTLDRVAEALVGESDEKS